jgi:hypothetical protein
MLNRSIPPNLCAVGLSFRFHRNHEPRLALLILAEIMQPRIALLIPPKSCNPGSRFRFWPKAVGARLAGDLPRTGSEISQLGEAEKPRAMHLLPVPGRSPTSRLPRPPGRSASA